MLQPATLMGAIATRVVEVAGPGEGGLAELVPRRLDRPMQLLMSRAARGRVVALQAHTRPHLEKVAVHLLEETSKRSVI